ncbi:unnamed protein product, partial [Chrysoparadoxa australica]
MRRQREEKKKEALRLAMLDISNLGGMGNDMEAIMNVQKLAKEAIEKEFTSVEQQEEADAVLPMPLPSQVVVKMVHPCHVADLREKVAGLVPGDL